MKLDGKLKWSSGSATADTTLYRSAANVLKTDDSFNIGSGQTYKIDGDDVLTATSLGSTVVSSSLTSVGTLSSLNAATPSFTGPMTSSGVSTFSSSVNINGSLTAATPSFTGPLNSSGSSTFSSAVSVNGSLTAATPTFTGPLTSSGSNLFSGRTDISEIRETIYPSSTSAGSLTCNYNNGCVFYLPNGADANLSINITNLPTDNNYATTISIIVNQGVTAYYPTSFSIAGSGQTVKWANSTMPSSGNASKIDIWNFTLIRYNNAWTVLGSESKNYGA